MRRRKERFDREAGNGDVKGEERKGRREEWRDSGLQDRWKDEGCNEGVGEEGRENWWKI